MIMSFIIVNMGITMEQWNVPTVMALGLLRSLWSKSQILTTPNMRT